MESSVPSDSEALEYMESLKDWEVWGDEDALGSDENHEIWALVRQQETSGRESIRELLLDMDPFGFEHLVKRLLEEMDYQELSTYIERARANGEDVARHLVDLYLKVSFPVTCLIIVLVGAPLAANARRSSLANNFGLGALICFTYYGLLKAGQALGWNQMLDPLLGAWLGNIGFAVLCLMLWWRAHK